MVQTDVQEVQDPLGNVAEVNVATDHVDEGQRYQKRDDPLECLQERHRAQAGAMRVPPLQLAFLRSGDGAHARNGCWRDLRRPVRNSGGASRPHCFVGLPAGILPLALPDRTIVEDGGSDRAKFAPAGSTPFHFRGGANRSPPLRGSTIQPFQCSFTYSYSTGLLLMPRSGGATQAAILPGS